MKELYSILPLAATGEVWIKTIAAMPRLWYDKSSKEPLMLQSLKNFTLEVFRDYAGRFWGFWVIIYAATVAVELLRQVLLENLPSLVYTKIAPEFFFSALIGDFKNQPLLLLPLLGILVANAWGFSALYFYFHGHNAKRSLLLSLKNLHRYLSFLVAAGVITFSGFLILTVPTLTLLEKFLGIGVSQSPLLFLPLAVLALPGLYLLVLFSNAPFILLLENKNVFRALRESVRRISGHWWKLAIVLGISLLEAGILFYALSWIIFTLKLSFLPSLSLRGESMLRVFFYSVPWVVAASFYDCAVYHLYLRFKKNSDSSSAVSVQPAGDEKKIETNGPLISSGAMKSIAIFTLIAFIATFVIVPAPVQAGGGAGFAFGFIVGLISCFAGCFGFAALSIMSVVVSTVISTVVSTSLALMSGTQTLVGGGLLGGCSGSFDPVFGTCTTRKDDAFQEINNLLGIKINKFINSPVPTPEEFREDPDTKGEVEIQWHGNAPQGFSENLRVYDSQGNSYPAISGETGIACTQGDYSATYLLSFEKEFNAKIGYEICDQRSGGHRSRQHRAVCSGCREGGVAASSTFSTPALPLPTVDIKANGRDGGLVFAPGVPVTLSWDSQYATACEASGGWSGVKPVSGTETAAPQSTDDVFVITCRRGEKSGSDSVSSSPPVQREIRIFEGGTGGQGGGSSGQSAQERGLQIVEFNVPEPLNPGDNLTISWSVREAISCEVDNGVGPVPTVGQANITFLRPIILTMTCRDDEGNTVSATRAINVRRAPGSREVRPQ